MWRSRCASSERSPVRREMVAAVPSGFPSVQPSRRGTSLFGPFWGIRPFRRSCRTLVLSAYFA